MCEVVNLKKDQYDVYIGRAGKGQDGYFGNPFVVSATTSREKAISEFELYARNRLVTDAEWAKRIKELKGKRLGCFCKPLACHGDVLKKICEELNS